MSGTIAAIAAGGATGAVARHYMNSAITLLVKVPFPVAILSVNILGCFVMGMLVAAFGAFWSPPQALRAFLTVGFLGGFTTFSAFSLDTMTLWSRGDPVGAIVYVFASMGLSIAAVFAGSALIWKFVS
ncbi:MAG: fluoride efflux transporter CrcB [Alphaproteobacteria bacterium]|nr:fluoride efflux transporter CrcB [Alphaproteobacteria bacterium]